MTEFYPSDAELNALSGTNDADQEVLYVSTGESPYYASFYKMLYRLLLVAKRAGDLRVYKDGDMTFGVRSGRYYNGDTFVSYTGSTANALTNNATNYIYLTVSGSLVTNTTGFPAPSVTPHIPLATITTSAGNYSITDGDLVDERGRAIFQICGAESSEEVTVYNDTGSDISAGDLLAVCGWNAANNCWEVEPADADDPAKPAQLIATEDISNGSTGVATNRYDLTGVDTSAAAAVGASVYLSATPSGWTLTAPGGADQVRQEVGVVTVKDAAGGAIRFYLGLGATRERIGTSALEDSAVTATKLASETQDFIPNLNLTGTDDGDGTGSCAIQARDAANNNLAQRFLIRIWIADAEYGEPDPQTDFSVTTGEQMRELEADADYEVISDANGAVDMNINTGGAKTVYIMAEIDGRVYSSGSINITTT